MEDSLLISNQMGHLLMYFVYEKYDLAFNPTSDLSFALCQLIPKRTKILKLYTYGYNSQYFEFHNAVKKSV